MKSVPLQKSNLRKLLTQKRLSLSDSEKYQAETEVLNKFQGFFQEFRDSQKEIVIGGYMPIKREFNVLRLFRHLESLPKDLKIRLAMPYIISELKRKMVFKEVRGLEDYRVGRYSFLEPKKSNLIVEPDLLLMPFIGADHSLNRLGYGYGYYDRYIQNLKQQKSITQVGVGFDILLLERGFSIQVEEGLDQKMDFILTEKQRLELN